VVILLIFMRKTWAVGADISFPSIAFSIEAFVRLMHEDPSLDLRESLSCVIKV